MQVRTTVRDLASRKLKGLGTVGKRAGDSIAKGFLKAQLALGALKIAIKGASSLVRSLTTDFAETADRTAKLARQLGVNVQGLSEFGHIAEFAGTSLEDVGKSVRFVQRSLAEAQRGTKTYLDAFQSIGITGRDIHRLMSQDVLRTFEEVGLAIGAAGTQAEKTNAAMMLMGRAGTAMIPVFEQGAVALRKQREELRFFGVALTDVQAAMAEEFQDARKRFGDAIEGIRNMLASQIMPTLTEFMNRLATFIAENRDTIVNSIKTFMGFIASSIVGALQFVSIEVAKLVDMLKSLNASTFLASAARHPALGGLLGQGLDRLGLLPEGGTTEAQDAVIKFWKDLNKELKRLKNVGNEIANTPAAKLLGVSGVGPDAEKDPFRGGISPASPDPRKRDFFRKFVFGAENEAGELIGGIKESVMKIREQLRPEALGMTTVTMLTNAWTGFFDAITFGAKSAEDAFKDMAFSMLRQMAQLANQAFFAEVLGLVTGAGNTTVEPGLPAGFTTAGTTAARGSTAARQAGRTFFSNGLVQ
jgi:hypothetical protein